MSVVLVSTRTWHVDIAIGGYRTKDPSESFMRGVLREYETAVDVNARGVILMRFAGYWPRVLVMLGDHLNSAKVFQKRKFMKVLRSAHCKRVRLEGPLARPASEAPAVISLHDRGFNEGLENAEGGLDPMVGVIQVIPHGSDTEEEVVPHASDAEKHVAPHMAEAEEGVAPHAPDAGEEAAGVSEM
jgi:hypothetical protein